MTARAQQTLFPFFALAFGLSWSFWVVAVLMGAHAESVVGRTLLYAGTPGPFIAALLMLYLRGSAVERRDFWRRIYEVERLRPRWLAVVVLTYPALTVLAVALDRLAGGALPDPGRLLELVRDPVLLLATLGVVFLLGPLPEEPGWRGYALDRLQALRGALVASLALGLAWALWHLPLFFLPGSYQHGLGLGSLAFWLFHLTVVAASVFITWVYQHNERSTFAAILFHGTINLSRSLVPLSGRAELVRALLLSVLAVGIVLRCRPVTLADCR
jgi:membrane protease YdiL (CAAX protease family)